MKRIVVWTLLAAAAAGAGVWSLWPSQERVQYRTAKVDRGDIWVTVTASGNVQPVTQVQVGTQVSGSIQSLGADFNSRVTAGQVIAQIDPASFHARVEQDKANLARAQAEVERVKASFAQADKELARARELARRSLISPSELDAAEAAHLSLQAQIRVAEATVAQSRAALENSQVNLRYTTIVSPVDGIVISRNVDVGQTVAASLQAPTLFLIAANLKKIRILASVSEADIGRIFEGQNVSFTVDAYRDRRFPGTVEQVRLAPTTVQNVVTYTAVVGADNPDERLLPGMTASVSFEIERREDVLRVPNASLRFTPPGALPLEPPPKPPIQTNGHGRGEDRRRWRGIMNPPSDRGRVWVLTHAGPKAVSVRTGITDGSYTQIVEGDLLEGQEVIVGHSADPRDAPMNNPFGPPRFGPQRR